MPKIRIERVAKLELEDRRDRSFNIITGAVVNKNVWLNALGDQ
jgi:hypothetical protein